jgi:hypothetical protein
VKEEDVEIVPFESIGKLSFGDSRDIARQKLGFPFTTFEKVIGADATDAFEELGLHLYYDNDDHLEFVEAFEPACVVFRGISFLGRDLGRVLEDMQAIGFKPTEFDVGVNFQAAGIALTAPSGVVEGIAVYLAGYYGEEKG